MNNTVPPPASSVPIDLITNGHFDVWQRGNNVSGNTLQIGPDCWRGNGNLARVYSRSPDGCTVAATDTGFFMGLSQRIEWSKALNDLVLAAGCVTVIYEYAANQSCVDYLGNQYTQTYTWHTNLAIVPFTASDGETALARGYYAIPENIGIHCLANGDPLPVGFSFTVKFARCLIGAYTLDSAPPYVPPDPAVELMRCRRYYQTGSHYFRYPTAAAIAGTMYSVTTLQNLNMRTTPTITTQSPKTPNVQNSLWVANGVEDITYTNLGVRYVNGCAVLTFSGISAAYPANAGVEFYWQASAEL